MNILLISAKRFDSFIHLHYNDSVVLWLRQGLPCHERNFEKLRRCNRKAVVMELTEFAHAIEALCKAISYFNEEVTRPYSRPL